jgi:excinuclease UvrABC nuclease subunit
MSTATWLSHEFQVLQHGASWNHVSGVYVFAGTNTQNQWHALYVGQAESFANRIPSHERWPEAVRAGATHVHAKAVGSAAERDALEQSLIRAYQPRLNTQLR